MITVLIGVIGFMAGGIVGMFTMAVIAATTRPDADLYTGMTDDDFEQLMSMVNHENPKD